jgi:hypothetical protein
MLIYDLGVFEALDMAENELIHGSIVDHFALFPEFLGKNANKSSLSLSTIQKGSTIAQRIGSFSATLHRRHQHSQSHQQIGRKPQNERNDILFRSSLEIFMEEVVGIHE